MSEIKLRPCPFCGGQAHMVYPNVRNGIRNVVRARVECSNPDCCAYVMCYYMDTPEEAAAMWNGTYFNVEDEDVNGLI